jgi:hypothetical protein
MESPYRTKAPVSNIELGHLGPEAARLGQDPGSISSQVDSLVASVEELGHQISRLEDRISPITSRCSQKEETNSACPGSTPLGQHLAECNSSLRVQIVRLVSIIDSVGL